VPEGGSFVEAAGLRWFVQAGGRGPLKMLMLHGTGASSHSFDALATLLGQDFSTLALDLPGHGDTGRAAPSQLSMPGMSAAVSALLQVLEWRPDVALGHSAGAALAARMVLDGLIAPRAIVAINGAFLPFGGWAAPLFTPLAHLLYRQAWVPRLFARRARDPEVVRRLVEGTGSRLDAVGLAAYQKLITRPGQAEAALGMMAHWELGALANDLPRLTTPLWLLNGSRDRAVPAAQALRVAERCQSARRVLLPGLGHLAHEEDPAAVTRCIDTLSFTGGP
jgi:magnesium chelatase accessory protein